MQRLLLAIMGYACVSGTNLSGVLAAHDSNRYRLNRLTYGSPHHAVVQRLLPGSDGLAPAACRALARYAVAAATVAPPPFAR